MSIEFRVVDLQLYDVVSARLEAALAGDKVARSSLIQDCDDMLVRLEESRWASRAQWYFKSVSARLHSRGYMFDEGDELGLGAHPVSLLSMPDFQPLYDPVGLPSRTLAVAGKHDYGFWEYWNQACPNFFMEIDIRSCRSSNRFLYGSQMVFLSASEMKMILNCPGAVKRSAVRSGTLEFVNDTFVEMLQASIDSESIATASCVVLE